MTNEGKEDLKMRLIPLYVEINLYKKSCKTAKDKKVRHHCHFAGKALVFFFKTWKTMMGIW